MPRSRNLNEDEELGQYDDLDGDEDGDEDVAEVELAAGEEPEDEDLDFEEAPASAAARASAARLLELLVEKKALALYVKEPGSALIERVAQILESPLPLKTRASKISEAIVDSEDVDDFFLDDETLSELLKRW